MGFTWEEAEVAALDRHGWRRSVAQCVQLDVGWIEVKVKVTRFLKKQNVLCTLLVIKTPKDLGCIATLPCYVAKVKIQKC